MADNPASNGQGSGVEEVPLDERPRASSAQQQRKPTAEGDTKHKSKKDKKEKKERPRAESIDVDDHSSCCDPLPQPLKPDEIKSGTAMWPKVPQLAPNAWGAVAYANANKGGRQSMEDRHRIIYGQGSRGYFAVFDGHGGQDAAQVASVTLHRYVRYEHEEATGAAPTITVERPSSSAERGSLGTLHDKDKDKERERAGSTGNGHLGHDDKTPSVTATPRATGGKARRVRGGDEFRHEIERAFDRTEHEILHHSRKHSVRDGTTASVIFLYGDTIYCANVGDSRTVLARHGQAVALSRDHKPADEEEKKRILAAGGEVRPVMKDRAAFCCFKAKKVPQGADRLWPGGFSVSRALGDIDYKDPKRGKVKVFGTLICKPDIVAMTLTRDDQFAVTATDGLWDALTNQDVVDLVLKESKKKGFNPATVAKTLADRAFSLGSEDNITVVVVFFTHHRQFSIDQC